MGYSHYWPQRLGLALSFVALILSVPHFLCIVVQDLWTEVPVSSHTALKTAASQLTASISSNPSGGLLVLDVLILGMTELGGVRT